MRLNQPSPYYNNTKNKTSQQLINQNPTITIKKTKPQKMITNSTCLSIMLQNFNNKCSTINGEIQQLQNEQIQRMFKYGVQGIQYRVKEKDICQGGQGNKQCQKDENGGDRSRVREELVWTSKKLSRRVSNASSNANAKIQKQTKIDRQSKNMHSVVFQKLDRKIANLKVPYQEMQSTWQQNFLQNEQIVEQQLKKIHQNSRTDQDAQDQNIRNSKCIKQQQQTQKDGGQNDQNLDRMKTSKKQRYSDISNPFSNQVSITPIAGKATPLMNAPKKQPKFMKITNLQQQYQYQYPCGQQCQQKQQGQYKIQQKQGVREKQERKEDNLEQSNRFAKNNSSSYIVVGCEKGNFYN